MEEEAKSSSADDGNLAEKKLKDEESRYERFAKTGGVAVVLGLLLEVVLAALFPNGQSVLEEWGPVFSDALIALGVASEVLFAAIARSKTESLKLLSDARVSEANERAAKAFQRAEEEHNAQVKLEANLQPRSINLEQLKVIHGLRGRFTAVNIGYETDAETSLFARQLRDALVSAGILVTMFPRAADIHIFNSLIYEPKGVDVEPLSRYLQSLMCFRRSP